MQPFVHLHVHSQFSLLDGQASVAGLIDKASKDGMPGIALTDHGAMFGIKEFYNCAKKKNAPVKAELAKLETELSTLSALEERTSEQEQRLNELPSIIEATRRKIFKPILGCEAYCARRHRTLKENAASAPDDYKPNRSIDQSGWHLVLLAKNQKGYKNLIKMVSYSWTEGYYYRPRIDRELLEKYHEGIIVSTACLGGEVPQHILNERIDRAEETIQWFKGIFGDDFYLELQRHETNNPLGNAEVYPEQVRVNRVLLELAEKHNVKVIATNDAHFINEEDAEAHDRLICLSTGKDIDDPKRMRYSKQEWLKSTEEMNAVFSDLPEALSNTIEILDKVEEYSIDSDALMPDFPIPAEFENDDAYLRHLTYIGAEKKFGTEGLTDEVRQRIDFELETIEKMGFPGYFLIVQDFIAAAREMGVFVGPGRGSAAGSVVAYCLGITDIDPIKYDLLFERFLNPDRISMPDIDIDFDDDGRADVLHWVTEKYGKERVAHIITYGTMATKSSIKDVARVHRLPIPESNRLAKLVPDKIEGVKKVTLKDAIEHVPELRQASIGSNPLLSETLKYAQQLEGNIRNTGVHACGIIIGKTDISDIVPISTATDKATGEDMLVTQYEGATIEETGLIKMDFLGLKTLSIIKETIQNIKLRHGIDINIDTIPLDDPKTYQLYSEGKTVGTFQFESAGMQKYLRELQPTKFEDLIAMNALYRPGPMDYIPDFIARKHGRVEITYDLPCMERYLQDTYGITVYQEQVMLLSREIANFTRGQSDELRKAMGKKLEDKMAALKVKFIDGGQQNGYDGKLLEKIWTDWAKFASYAFNKSHSTCYSWIAYQTAYLKANYPSEYLAGALSRNLDKITEITKLMDEARAMGIRVLVPDINESQHKFSVNSDGNIRFGLNAIKGVSSAAIENIITERTQNGPYSDIYDFMVRTNLSTCNRKTLESLVFSGCFDSFGIEREVYIEAMPDGRPEDIFLTALVRYGFLVQEDKHSSSNSLFGADVAGMEIPIPEPPSLTKEISLLERLSRERELVGLYLSSNPLSPFRVVLEHYCNSTTEQLNEGELTLGQQFIFGGAVSRAFRGLTKKGDPYGRLTIEDTRGSFEFPLFAKTFLDNQHFLIEGLFLLVRATVIEKMFNPGELELQIDQIELLNDVHESLISQVKITIPAAEINTNVIHDLNILLENNSGDAVLLVQVVDETGDLDIELTGERTITPSLELLEFCEQRGYKFKAE